MNFFLVATTIFYSLTALVREILFCHSKINFISYLNFISLGLEYGPRPAASDRTQDLWHSFSQYGPPGRQITYMYGSLLCHENDTNVFTNDWAVLLCHITEQSTEPSKSTS